METGSGMSTDAPAEWPRIGVVIPVFGHSKLVAEAIDSVLRQEYPGEIHTVVVVDGDRHPETLQTASSFVGAKNRSVSAIFRPNGRLPAARNTGIRYLLARFDDLFAIQFLDADNRLSNLSIRAYVEALRDDPGAAWAFPDVSFFGLSSGYSGIDVRVTALRYSRFRHLIGNICEAGSMVRTEVFQKGIFYDESFVHGYEDWEFWLQCLDQGMVGTRAENAGFLYRRRADSMLADADRMSQEIIAKIRAKHRTLYSEKTAWTFFAEDFRPLLVANADGTATALSTAAHASALDEAGLAVLVLEVYQHFFHTYMPKFVLYPLSAGSPALRFDLKLLKRLILADDDKRMLFLDARGLVQASRSDDSVWGAIRLVDVLAGADAPPELASHPIWGWIHTAAWRASQAPVSQLSRRYSGPGSFRIEGFLRDVGAVASTAVAEDTITRRRCLLVYGSESAPDPELIAALREAYEVTMVNFDALDHAQSMRRTIYGGAPFGYRNDGPAYDFLGQITSAFDKVYLLGDFSYLFLAGQWKRGTELVFVAPTLSADENIAMQGVEHSLSKIVCLDNDLTELAAVGIPAHKLETRAQHLAALGRQTFAQAGNR